MFLYRYKDTFIYNWNKTNIMDHERITKIYATKNLPGYIEEFVNQHEKPTTRYNYQYILNRFFTYCQDNNIKELREENIQSIVNNYKAFLINNGTLASSSIDNYLLRLQSFCTSLNLKIKLQKISDTQPGKYKYLTYNQIGLLINSIPLAIQNPEQILKYTAIIKILFTAGLRINELLNITFEDILPNNDTTIVFIKGKGKAYDQKQSIVISNTIKQAIDNYVELRPVSKTNYVFVNTKGNKLTRQTVNNTLKRIAKKCDEVNGTDIAKICTTHVFRHSLARFLLIDQQKPISQVRDVLRHKSIETTNKYLTNTEDEINEIRANIII